MVRPCFLQPFIWHATAISDCVLAAWRIAAAQDGAYYWCRDEAEVASQTEDRLLEALKNVGARVDSAVGTFTNLSSFGRVEQSEVGHHASSMSAVT